MKTENWKVIAMFDEMGEDEQGNETIETTIMYERGFRDYYDMLNYVSDCKVNGCIDGQVYREMNDGRWEYYMDII